MKFDKGSALFAYQAGATASVTFTASTRNVIIENIEAWAFNSSAIVQISRSSTLVWQGQLNSAGTGRGFYNLSIESLGESTLSAGLGSSTSGILSVFGREVQL